METYYYAYADKADNIGNKIFLEFHCMTVAELSGWLDSTEQAFRAVLEENRVPVIVLNTSRNLLSARLNFREEPDSMESEWFRLTTNDTQQGLQAAFFPDEAEQVNIYINGLEPVDEETRDKLDRLTSMDNFEDAQEDKLYTALNKNPQSQGEYIAVYHVGQGNCNAVCDYRGVPLLYFDLGGGCYKNKSSYPAVLRFCFTEDPTIILSHWDTDHYESAKRNTLYQTKTWIVPRQTIGPAHKKFLLSLQSSGTVLIWPKGQTTMSFSFGVLVLCTHPNPKKKNHSGLAFMVTLSPHYNTIKDVLLPADAAYTYIPVYGTGTCDGLVATHHGAEFDTINAPVPVATGKSAIAYSYGNPNSYKHPRAPAIAAHTHANRRDTKHGHIALTDQSPSAQPCGTSCDLQIIQTY